MDRIAVRVLRGDVVESLHRASIAVSNPRGRMVASFGDPNLVTFLRSAAKPMQALVLLESGAADRFRMTSAELAVVAGSHNGEERHVHLVEGLLSRIGLRPSDLKCGVHAPYGKEAAKRVGAAYSALHHNCSGKHAGMLAACVHNGWDVASYQDESHPLQQRIRSIVAEECGIATQEVRVGTDGCGVPSFAVPLRRAARSFARLMDAERVRGPRGEALRRVRDAMLEHPDLVAGDDRTDTKFMRAAPGDLLVKAGAEACYGFGLRRQALGGVIKIEDGATRAIPPLLLRVLAQVGSFAAETAARLEAAATEPVRNGLGRVVGSIQCDVVLKRPRRKVPLTA